MITQIQTLFNISTDGSLCRREETSASESITRVLRKAPWTWYPWVELKVTWSLKKAILFVSTQENVSILKLTCLIDQEIESRVLIFNFFFRRCDVWQHFQPFASQETALLHRCPSSSTRKSNNFRSPYERNVRERSCSLISWEKFTYPIFLLVIENKEECLSLQYVWYILLLIITTCSRLFLYKCHVQNATGATKACRFSRFSLIYIWL